MRLVRVEDAVGQVLGYDTTYVGKDGGATVLLPRGHVITRDDVERLKDSGVYFVWVEGNEESSDLMYEWEIARQWLGRWLGGRIRTSSPLGKARPGSWLALMVCLRLIYTA